MSECIHLLPNHCAETEFSVKELQEPSWEQKDYVEVANDRVRQEEPNPAQFTAEVTMRDIHGTHQAIRLKKRSA